MPGEISLEYLPEPLLDCPLCGSKERDILFQEENKFAYAHAAWSYLNSYPVSVARCRGCSFGFTAELPPTAFFEKVLYSPPVDAPVPAEPSQASGKDFIFHGVLELLEAHGAKGCLVDLGACNGRFLWHAKAKFSPALGIENDPIASALAARHGIEIRVGGILSTIAQAPKADIITLIDVLEHLPNPRAHLEATFHCLKPNALLYVKVPRLEGQAFKEQLLERLGFRKSKMAINYVHINHFTLNSLTQVLQKIGFRIEHAQIARPELYDWQQGGVRGWTSNIVRLGHYFFSRALFSLTKINLGLNIEVLARKK